MSDSNDIYWSEEKNVNGLSFVPGVDAGHKFKQTAIIKNSRNSSQKNVAAMVKTPAKLKKPAMNTKAANTSFSGKSKPVSLRDLCPEDKERVANLIRELAKAGEEKEATESMLNNERRQFAIQVEELKADKERIEQEQRSLLSEFKDCQRLLVFYQQKITEEQKEVAKDINRLLTETSFNKSQVLGSSRKVTPRCVKVDVDDITVKEVDGTISSHRSAADSAVSDNPYMDTTGALGESFRPAVKETAGVLPPPKHNGRVEFVSAGKKDQRVGFASREYDSCSEDVEVLPSRDINTVESSTSDDQNHGFNDAFERRINALSPNGRREALLKQKRELEVEQAHLQSLLAEQEEILKYRQEELRKRHVDYSRRMKHFKHHGAFPSVLSGAGDLTQGQSAFEETEYSDYADDPTGVDTSHKSTSVIEIGSPRRRSSRHRSGPRSEPVLRSRKYAAYSPSVNDDATDDVTESLTSSCPVQPSLSPVLNHTESVVRRKTRTGDTGAVHDHNNFSSAKKSNGSSRKSPKLSKDRNSTLQSTNARTKPTNHGNVNLSHTDLSTTYTPQRRMHTTMNNLSTLSDLVSSVDISDSPVADQAPLFFSQSTLSNPRSDDTLVSTVFDPEDSQLLEDIFFIK